MKIYFLVSAAKKERIYSSALRFYNQESIRNFFLFYHPLSGLRILTVFSHLLFPGSCAFLDGDDLHNKAPAPPISEEKLSKWLQAVLAE